MPTPEAAVKAKLRVVLSNFRRGMYTYWPVPSGYGRTSLDVLGCYRGRFFVVETKAPKKKPTLRQQTELEAIARAMGRTFVCIGTDSPVFLELEEWLREIANTVPYDDSHIPPDQTARRVI